MAHSSKPTIRLIAEKTGFSKATVANALNGTPTVSKATAQRIQLAAEELGYRRNPMVGSLMSAIRRSGSGSLQGVLAVVEICEPGRPDHGLFHRDLLEGCREGAQELGFGLDFFQLKPGELSPERLSGILKARGIRGVVVLPSWMLPDFGRFDWTWLTGVYAEYLSEEPSLNCVCCDHYRSILSVLEKLWERGYRRPGIIFEKGREERIHMRMSAALRTFQTSHAEVHSIPPEYMKTVSRDRVIAWVDEANPDVVLSHVGSDLMDWLRESGRTVPEDIGYFCLNLAKTQKPIAGLDLRPREIGRIAVEQLIAQVQRAAWGRVGRATTTSFGGEFVDGPTIRAAPYGGG